MEKSSLEKKTPTAPQNDHRKKKSGDIESKEAAVHRKAPSCGKGDQGCARRHAQYVTETVSYVSGGVLKQVHLKVPVIRLNGLDFWLREIRAMKSDSKENWHKAPPAAAKPEGSAVSYRKQIPIRATRNNSPPQCKAALSGSELGDSGIMHLQSRAAQV
ncbi:hypothetical protein MRX96_015297 [Rhipicephalus microplus]